MNIVLLEPFYSGSHKSWADSLKRKSSHNIEILSIDNKSWKNAMLNGAMDLAHVFLTQNRTFMPDLILSNDLVDLPVFVGASKLSIPTAVYFHENQLTYPWSSNEKNLEESKKRFGLMNYKSALLADKCFFNSSYHLNSFIGSLDSFLDDLSIKSKSVNIEKIKSKSEVLYLGLDLKRFDIAEKTKNKKPIILWNHRWEYDKNPRAFFETLKVIKEKKIEFELIILGEHFHENSPTFLEAKEFFKDEIIHCGYVESFNDYAKYLHLADILPVTSNQDFFGASIVEAIYCEVIPLLPNRLSYLELLPEKLHADFIYNEESELESKLEALILSCSGFNYQLKNHVSKFDWGSLIELYDLRFRSSFDF